jgi:hypothetical protein
VVYVDNGILFSHKEEQNTDSKMDGTGGLSKISQTQKDKYGILFLIYRRLKKKVNLKLE